MSKEKVKKFFKEHKAEIKYGTIAVAATVGTVVGLKKLLPVGEQPYKLLVRSSDKDYIDLLEGMFNWHRGEKFSGGSIGWGYTADELAGVINDLLSDPDKDSYEYSLLLERIKK